MSLLITILAIIWAGILLLVGGRFLALLANANRDSEIVDALYRWSEPFVEPFFSMFSLTNEAVDGGGTFEPASLLAFIVYFIVGALVVALVSGAATARFRHA